MQTQTAQSLINDLIDRYEEYLEMVDDPSAFIAEVLAHKVISLNERIEYLEKLLIENQLEKNKLHYLEKMK